MPLLTQVLSQPEQLLNLNIQQLDLLIRQARVSKLLPRIASMFEQHNNLEIPESSYHLLKSAKILADANYRALQWELNRIQLATEKQNIKVILLKGAAYAQLDLPNSRGRLFGDIDLLIPKAELANIEELLKWHGWVTTHHNDYDQKYYRKWMHELPPLQHIKRKSVIDLHHTLIPPTSRYQLNSEKVFQQIKPLKNQPYYYTLSNYDLILHSCVHLFGEGEWEHGLRDLLDIRDMIQYYQKDDAKFLDQLCERANKVGLSRSLYYALYGLQEVLHVSFEPSLKQKLKNKPNRVLNKIMGTLLKQVITPHHPSCFKLSNHFAEFIMYLRGHYLRMPMHLLIPHLIIKSFSSKEKSSPQQNQV